MIEDCIYYGTDGFFMKDQTVKRLVQLLHDFSEELIGKDEKLPAIQVTAECAEKMGGLIASSKGRNQFRQSQRKLRDKLLVKKQT